MEGVYPTENRVGRDKLIPRYIIFHLKSKHCMCNGEKWTAFLNRNASKNPNKRDGIEPTNIVCGECTIYLLLALRCITYIAW